MTGQVNEITMFPADPHVVLVTVPDAGLFDDELIVRFGPDSAVTANGSPVTPAGLLALVIDGWADDLTDPTRPVFVTVDPTTIIYGATKAAAFTR